MTNSENNFCQFLVFFCASLFTALPDVLVGDEFTPSSSRRLLFLDDHDIAEMKNVKRTLHQPTKRGAVIRSSKESETIQIRTAPAWDPEAKVYKIWLLSTDRPLWTSEDGLNWSPGPVPNLRTDHVVYDPHDPDPNRRYKAAQTNEYFAASPDGVTWKKLDVEKIQSLDESNLSYDPNERLFIHSVKRTAKHGRAVAIAVSRDFQKWDDYGVVFQADDVDQQLGKEAIRKRVSDSTRMPLAYVDEKTFRVDVYNLGVFYYEGLYIGMPAMFYSTGPIPNYPNTEGFHYIQLTVSRDLKSWHRVCDREIFIDHSRLDSGAYDLTEIMPPSTAVVRGDELWFYYTGIKYRSTFHYHGTYPNGRAVPKTDLEPDHAAVCLAVLRKDGFVSLDGGGDEGFVLTKPFSLNSDSMRVNLKAREKGSATVELINANNQTVTASEPIEGDGVRLPVRWTSIEKLKPLIGKQVQLKVRLRDASLFSIDQG